MEKKYYSETNHRTPRPRSKRLRELGAGGSGYGLANASAGSAFGGIGGGHTHANKDTLDALLKDDDGYLNITRQVENEETGEAEDKTEKVKAGSADKFTTLRKLWGQDFDGTKDISEHIHLGIGQRIYFGDESHYIELAEDSFHFSHGVRSDSFVNAFGYNGSSAPGGGGISNVLSDGSTGNVVTGISLVSGVLYYTKGTVAASVAYNDLTVKPTSAQIQALVGNYVSTFGSKTGAITVRGGQTVNGSVNLAMSNNELQASIVGLGSAAYTASTSYAASSHTHKKSDISDFPTSMPASDVSAWAKKTSLEASDVPNLGASKITSGTFDFARLPKMYWANVEVSSSSSTTTSPTFSSIKIGDATVGWDSTHKCLLVDAVLVSESFVSGFGYNGSNAPGGGGITNALSDGTTGNVITGISVTGGVLYYTKGTVSASVAYNDLTTKPTSAQIQALVGNYVSTFGSKTGAITVRGGQTGNGSVNLAMSNNELQASIVGLGSAAYTASTAYAASGHTHTYNDLTTKPTSAQIQALVGNYVSTFGSKTGAIAVRGGQTGNGSVNLAMSNNELQASIVGLGSAAYTASTAYAASSHTHTYSDMTGTVPTWNQNTTGNAATATAVQDYGNTSATVKIGYSGSSLTSCTYLAAYGSVNGQTVIKDISPSNITAGSASKLTTVSKSAWGKTYWTSGGVPTDIKGNITSDYFMIQDTSNNPYLKLVETYSGTTTNWYVQGYQGKLFLGAGSAKSMSVDADGNVRIKGNLIAEGNVSAFNAGSGSAVLDKISFNGVNAEISASGDEDEGYVIVKADGLRPSDSAMTLGDASHRFSLYSTNINASNSAIIQNKAVVGYTSLQTSYQFAVNGACNFNGTVYVKGVSTHTSDIRLKTVYGNVGIDVRDIADAPLIEYAYKEDESGAHYIGTTAQYWMKIMPLSVKEDGEGWLSLDYTGVTMASVVSLAKRAVDHESRIHALEVENERLKGIIDKFVPHDSE